MARCRIPPKSNKKLYEELENELEETAITVASASTSHVCNRKSTTHARPIASLVIPNKLYLLWNRKADLQEKLGIAKSELLGLCNDRIAGDIRLKDTLSVKERLRKQSIRLVS